jgi:4-amino-4-deoxy-L-arabinose transferase-like glycosyltransferase
MTMTDPTSGRKLRPLSAARRRIAAVPSPLAILLAVVTLFVVVWALVIPLWAGPDEDVHFSYVQTLAERHELPGKGPQSVSTEQLLSVHYTNTGAVTFFDFAKPEWSHVVDSQWRELSRDAPRDDGGAYNGASAYPATYYALASLAYDLAGSGTVATRLYLTRLFSGLWMLVATVGAWLLAGEMFGRRRQLQLVTAAATGLWPMTLFISSKVNPDAMVIALYALALWLGAAILLRGLTFVRAVAICAVLGVALATKATTLALVPAVAFALVLGAWRLRSRVSWRAVARAAAVVAVLALPVGTWFAVAHSEGRSAYAQVSEVAPVESSAAPADGGDGGSAGGSDGEAAAPPSPTNPKPFSVNEFGSYLWQYYLPRLPFQQEIRFLFPAFSTYPAFQVWLAGSWANFGWANVWFPEGVYVFFAILVAIAAIAAAAAALARMRSARGRFGLAWLRAGPKTAVLVFFVLAVGALVAGLHWSDFYFYRTGGPAFLQGRYLLPLGAIFALVLAQATRVLPGRLRPAAAGAILAGLVVLNVACLGLVVDRYYAV